MSSHTPEPWSIYFNEYDGFVIRKMCPDGSESHLVARCYSGAADARLIAAAPALLDALRDCEARLALLVGSGCSKMLDAVAAEKARSTIAQATGEPA